MFRDLRADEIEVRIGNIIKDKDTKEPIAFQLLLYKTARVDANILDDTVGIYNWQKRFYQVKNTMVCSIGLYNEERNEWIWKDDGGDDDFTTEQVKGELSDSFKRAGFSIGIGRKLYTANKIYMVVNITDKNTLKSSYQVKEIAYDETSIVRLVIINKKTKEVVIDYKDSNAEPKKQEETSFVEMTENQKILINKIINEKNLIKEEVYRKFGISKGVKVSKQKASEIIDYLMKQPNKNSISTKEVADSIRDMEEDDIRIEPGEDDEDDDLPWK